MHFSLQDPLSELVTILFVTAAVGYIAVLLRQPVIIAAIVAGVCLGPVGLDLVRSKDQIHVLAQIGLAVLLFAVGLRLDLRLVRTLGPVALITGIGQIVLTAAGAYGICQVIGFEPLASLYISLSIAFSSTVVVVKLLSDTKEIDSLHGRIALGVLIVQDVVVILVMMVLSALGGKQAGSQLVYIFAVLGKGVALMIGAGFFSYLVFPRLLPPAARESELLVLVALVWALSLYGASEVLGFSGEVGAFLAGVFLASTPYRDFLVGRLITLRDFLLLFFFVEVGTRMDVTAIGPKIYSAVPLSIFALVGKPLIVLTLTGLLGYRKRTGFLSGTALGQISEFSLILIAMGSELGHVRSETVGIVTLVGLATIWLSTFMILNAHSLYGKISKPLSLFERNVPQAEIAITKTGEAPSEPEIIVFGVGRYGSVMVRELAARGKRILGVDFDPQAVKLACSQGYAVVFGDAEDPEFLNTLPVSKASWVVCTVRNVNTARALRSGLEHTGYSGNLALTAADSSEVQLLYGFGADLVFSPFEDASKEAVDLLSIRDEEIARKKMDRLIDQLSDHYIVCGYGRMGQQIARDLQSAGVPFVVVESNPEQLPKLKDYGLPHIVGRASEDEVLMRAGIKRAKGLVSVAPTDEANVFIVLTARVLNPDLFIVARSILVENESKLLRAGANRVMSPYILGGRLMAAAITQPETAELIDALIQLNQTETRLEQIDVPSKSRLIGKTLGEIDIWRQTGATVFAAKRGGQLFLNLAPEWILSEGDQLILIGTNEQRAQAKKLISEVS